MQIQINTGHHVDGREAVANYVRGVVSNAVSHYEAHLTRVEVHLADENGEKSGQNDKRCTMEARPEKLPPVAVSHHADSMNEAIDGAAGKLKRSLEHSFARLHEHR